MGLLNEATLHVGKPQTGRHNSPSVSGPAREAEGNTREYSPDVIAGVFHVIRRQLVIPLKREYYLDVIIESREYSLSDVMGVFSVTSHLFEGTSHQSRVIFLWHESSVTSHLSGGTSYQSRVIFLRATKRDTFSGCRTWQSQPRCLVAR